MQNKSIQETVYENCNLCPRKCNIDRTSQKGVCHTGNELLIARAALHMWEEPCISGKEGSGAVFFSGCSLGCVFCQNNEISKGQSGKEITKERLLEIFWELKDKGANNINLVTPDHFLPQVCWTLEQAKKKGLGIPFVYNCSGYERVEQIKELDGLVNVYLPDFKYYTEETAARYARAGDYPEVAKIAIDEMVRQTGKPVFDENQMIVNGVIVRHLLLPGKVKEAKQIVGYLHETYGNNIYISLMNQYTPMHELVDFPELNRKVTKREYNRLLQYAMDIGVENAFIQEGETAMESFIPPFNLEGI